MAKLADAQDLKLRDTRVSYRFDPGFRHHYIAEWSSPVARRAHNPKVMWFKSHLRNQSVCTKKMHRRNPQIPQGFLGIFHTRKQDANKKMQMVKTGLWVGFEPMTYSFWGEFQSNFSEIRPFFVPYCKKYLLILCVCIWHGLRLLQKSKM